MPKYLLPIWLLFAGLQALAVGQWTDYLSYNSAEKVALAGNRVYCVASGGLFCYDNSDNSIQKLNVIQGLSDVGVQTVAYADQLDMLIVAYENSNIDLLIGDEVYNMADIKRKQISGDKSIYHILVVDKVAYLSCGFGIVAINLEKREVKDTYYIGDNASQIQVNAMAFDGEYLYAATESGIYKAAINSSNLQYYNNWEIQTGLPKATGAFSHIVFFDGNIIACSDGGDTGNDALYAWNGQNWLPYLTSVTTVADLQSTSSKLVVSSDSKITVYRAGASLETSISSYEFSKRTVNPVYAQSAVIGNDGYLWVADQKYSLVKISGQGDEQIQPEGPKSNRVLGLTMNGTDLWKTDGGRTAYWNNQYFNPRIQLFRNGQWTSFDGETVPGMTGFHDMIGVTPDPADPDHVFAGSWGGGVLEFQGSELLNRYDNFNSSLQTALPSSPNEPFVRISDMQFDSNGNLWVVNAQVEKPLSVLTSTGEWEAYPLPGIQSSYNPGAMVITEDDDLWITIGREEKLMVVRKADGSEEKQLTVTAYYSNGTDEVFTPMTDIYDIVTDRDGEIWFGTAVGVGVYRNPEDVWTTNSYYASQPGLDEGDGLYHPLLNTQTVTAIAVDGANRKWCGTKTSGLYLVSEDGTAEIHHFTSENSPLPDDEITSLAINDQTGEVFIGTAKGLISYKGTATEGKDDYSDVYAYPNPVREDYEGDIVITGLIENTDIKITDITGNLVYKTNSLGGQATWDGKNLRGNRVSTGVYLVFGNDRYGEQSFVTKILFIH
jgi:ligand-binding sensor domain-containing protein